MADLSIIAGIDEAGRGPLAGPVVAGACIEIPELLKKKMIRDSKKMTEQQRDEAFEWITENCTIGIGIVSHEVIDTEGILTATERAMQMALEDLSTKMRPTYLLIDGRDKFWFDIPHTSIIGGDDQEACISAASIVAKVTRDRLMTEEAKKYPVYGFDTHKGYGAPIHIDMIKKHGPCPLHRKTFLRNILGSWEKMDLKNRQRAASLSTQKNQSIQQSSIML